MMNFTLPKKCKLCENKDCLEECIRDYVWGLHDKLRDLIDEVRTLREGYDLSDDIYDFQADALSGLRGRRL